MSVHVPPKTLANDNGIINCSFAIPVDSHHRNTIGIITATTGVLFKNPLTHATGIINRNCAPAVVLGFPKSFPMYQSSPPVALIPAATTNSAATVSKPSFANPASASVIVSTPARFSAHTESIMTQSL